MNLFICPICSQILKRKEKVYICKKNHVFDISAQGHVNLLPVNHKNSLTPGDDKDMVKARSLFLAKGYYSHLKETLEKIAIQYAKEDVAVLDCGCGEGYYTHGIAAALKKENRKPQIVGIDISKEAARLAAKDAKLAKNLPMANYTEFAVASSFHLPIAANSIDILVNCFSPLCIKEFARVLKKGGIFVYVVPGADHLWEMKCELYEKPYKNEEKQTDYDGFQYSKTVKAEKNIFLLDTQDVKNLFKMTPYVWKTPQGAKDKLLQKENLAVHTEFNIYIKK